MGGGSHVIKKKQNTIYCVTLSGVVGRVVLMSDCCGWQTQLTATSLVVCSCISWTTGVLAGKSCVNAVFSPLHFQTLWFITEMLPSGLMQAPNVWPNHLAWNTSAPHLEGNRMWSVCLSPEAAGTPQRKSSLGASCHLKLERLEQVCV